LCPPDPPFGPQSSGDDPFTARMRFHQSWYRAMVLRVPYGHGPRPTSKTRYGNMLAEEPAVEGKNFLTPEIHSVYRDRLARGGGDVEPFRCERNMLSSQPMCFNTFGPLVKDLSRATRFLRALLPTEIDVVTRADIEYRPPESALGDGTSFDAFFEYRSPRGDLAFLGIETKLTDTFSQKRYERERYVEITHRSDSPWKKDYRDRLPDPRFNQLWRNHLLVEATREIPRASHGSRGTLVLIHHSNDVKGAQVAAEYSGLLADPTSFRVFPLNTLTATWLDAAVDPIDVDWISKLQERYVRLEPSESDWVAFREASNIGES
jgi:hypothetical protein